MRVNEGKGSPCYPQALDYKEFIKDHRLEIISSLNCDISGSCEIWCFYTEMNTYYEAYREVREQEGVSLFGYDEKLVILTERDLPPNSER